MNQRILCLDVGDARIGVAVSDPTGTIASPVEVIQRVGWGPDTRRIKALCDRFETDQVLSGLPLNMDGTEGDRAALSRAFRDKVERRCGVPAVMSAESLTTVEADETMDSLGLRGRAERKQYVDMIAAGVILREYMDNHPKELERLWRE